jgi:hypothetical protein
MKFHQLTYKVGLAVFLLAAAAGCSKNDFNINKNPNQPTDSTISYDVILPAALHGTGDLVGTDWGFLQNWLGYWARSGTYAPNFTEETYTITTGFQNVVWNDAYNNAYDYQVMENKAKQAGAKFYEGIARIMKAHDFQVLVDIYNNVPYFEALKGSVNVTPKYDNGQDIYKDLFRQIDTGIALIKSATESQSKNIEKNDIMFEGNKTMWAKLGNTLKLRMLVHLHNGLNASTVVPGFDIAGEVAKITAEGSGFLGKGQSAEVQPGYRDDKPNPFYGTYVADATGTATANSVYFKANKWGIDYYGYNGDPRETYFYKAGSGGLKGVSYGLPPVNENAAAVLAGIGDGLGGDVERAQWVFTATESLFLQAEAAQRGILPGGPSAEQLWTDAIKENFVWISGGDYTEQDAQDWLDFNAGTGYPDVDFAADPMYAIISQKWFSLNGIATYEVWTDFRRTGIVYGEDAGFLPGPAISVSPNNTASKIPTRLLYPQTEYNYNAKNVGAQGTIDRYGRAFWDLN